ncbi:peptidase M36 [Photobacterium kishitanii]|uniref:proprotein convertase P-domain-containing protein n=2 Tax=Photobacterium kishitanii TaxID=318456 RepID=UPI00071AEECA|nr:proprotein convertase P-domain-containing protein [Photobacterium kishitanii]PSV09334.1 peptidase M36 [Photobacterium kishitanii]PSW65638.1 peptidase M36 [Photobacterium kishitanii]
MKKHILALLFPIVGLYGTAPLASTIDFPSDSVYVTSSDEVKRFLAQRYMLTGLVNESVSTSLVSTQYRFYQGFNNAIACSSSVVVTVDKNTKEVIQIYTHLLSESECQSAKDDNRAIDLNTPEQTYAPFVAAGSPKTIVTTTFNVFDPDPLTALEDTTLEYSDVISSAAYSLYSGVEVTEVEGIRYLENSRVRAVDVRAFDIDGDGVLESDISQQGIITSASDFTIERDIKDYENKNTQFLDTMAFYHIDKSVQYLQQLGFDIFSEPVQFDAFFGNKDNSTAYSSQNVIVFGNGVSADAEDADVILHELAHMINFSLVKRWRDGDTGAIGEGLGDYWAASSRYRTNKTFQPEIVFSWDGVNTSKISTRILNDTEARYVPGISYPAHVVRNGTNADQLWSTPLFQVLKLAIAEHGERVHEHIDRIIWEGIAALGGGVTMPDAALSIVKAAERLYPQSNYSDLFVKQFKAHNILTNTVVFYAPQFLMVKDEKATIPLDIYNISGKSINKFTGSFEQSDDVISFNVGVFGNSFSQKKQQATITVKVPDSTQCGEAFTLNAETVTDFNNQQVPTQDEYSIPFVICTPKLTHIPKVENSALIDATSTEGGLGGNKIGVKSYLLTLSDTAVLNNDFSVSLHIKHKRMSDLKVTLTPPIGDREITLLAYENIQQDEFNQQLMSRFNQEVNRLKGESLEGTWTLKVTDRAVGESGELVSWGIANISGYTKPETTKDNSNRSGGGSLGWLSLLVLVVIKLRETLIKNR